MTLPGKSEIDVTARDVGTPASSVSGPVTTKNALVERERRNSNHKKEKESKRQLGQSSSTWRNPALKQLERTTSLPNSQPGSRSGPCPPAVSERPRLIPRHVNLKTTPHCVLIETSHRTEITC